MTRRLATKYAVIGLSTLCLLELSLWMVRGHDRVWLKTLEVLKHLGNVFEPQPLYQPLAAASTSVCRTVVTIAISGIAGAVIGISCAMVRMLRLGLMPYLDFIRSVPITFLIPLIYGVKGLSVHWLAPVVLAAVPCSLIVCASIVERSASIDLDRLHTARILLGRHTPTRVLRHFFMWEVLSGVLGGMCVAIPYASILIGVLEYVNVGSAHIGFGYMVAQIAQNDAAQERMSYTSIAAVGLYGVFGLALLWGSSMIANNVASWDREAD